MHVKRVHDMYAISKEKVQLYNYANFNWNWTRMMFLCDFSHLPAALVTHWVRIDPQYHLPVQI